MILPSINLSKPLPCTFIGGIKLSEVTSGNSGGKLPDTLIGAWSAVGKSNEDSDRDVLKDLSGNGHDFHLYGFNFGGMSGYGGNGYDNLKISSTFASRWYTFQATDEMIYVNEAKPSPYLQTPFVALDIAGGGVLNVDCQLNIVRLGSQSKINLKFSNAGGTTTTVNEFSSPGTYPIKIDHINSDKTKWESFRFVLSPGSEYDLTCECYFHLIPKYPGALVFDGIDDYIQCEIGTLGEEWSLVMDADFSMVDVWNSAGFAKDGILNISPIPGDRINIITPYTVSKTVEYKIPLKAVTAKGVFSEAGYEDISSSFIGGNEWSKNLTYGRSVTSSGAAYKKGAIRKMLLYNSILTPEQLKKAYDYLQKI